MLWAACISGVPALALPKIKSSVGRSESPAPTAPAAWSIRANTVMPRAFTAASSRSMVSFGPWLLRSVVNPSTAIARSLELWLQPGRRL